MSARHIPKGWAVSTLGHLCDVISDGTHFTPKYVARGVPFFSVENVTSDDFINVRHISEEEHKRLIKRCRPRRNDILMTRIGSLADTKLLDWDVEASIYVSLALLRAGRQIDPRYLYAYTKTRKFAKDVEDRSLLWAVPKKINMSDIGGVPVLYPVSLAEQARVAEAILCAEEAEREQEKLLIKKQAIMQGMMQQLLSGSVRLLGFAEPWRKVVLGDVARIKTGTRNNQDKNPEGLYPFFVRSAKVERIDSYSYDCEAILVPGEGGIGSIFHYINGRFEVHQRVYKVSHFEPTAACGRFVYYYMRQFFGAHAMENSVKATVDSLRLPTFRDFSMHIPMDIAEQSAIASVLDEVNAELELLQKRLEKINGIKQGIMQELLAGRTRLHSLEPVA